MLCVVKIICLCCLSREESKIRVSQETFNAGIETILNERVESYCAINQTLLNNSLQFACLEEIITIGEHTTPRDPTWGSQAKLTVWLSNATSTQGLNRSTRTTVLKIVLQNALLKVNLRLDLTRISN